MEIRSYVLCCIIAASVRHLDGLVDVHFENKEGGFFLKHNGASRQPQQTPQMPQPFLGFDDVDGVASGAGGDNSVLSIDRFTVFQSSHPVSVRAVYGPFSTKQTVPARYIVPDPPAPPVVVGNGSALAENLRNDPLANGRRLEVSAHLVNHEIARDSPVLRVLFHTTGVERSPRKFGKQQAVCVVLHVTYGEQSPLTTACSPSLEDGQCLAEITVPSTWWPPLPGLEQSPAHKTPRRAALVSYYVLEPKNERSVEEGDWRPSADSCSPHLQIQPLTRVDSVPLVNARSGYRELKMDDLLFTLVPVASVYPRSKVYVPVYTRFQLKPSVLGFVIKGKVKSGLKILDAQCRQPEYWNLNFTPNQKFTAATVTVTMKNAQIPVSNAYNQSSDFSAATTNYKVNERIEEVFSWLLEVEHESVGDIWNEEAHIVWIVHYLVANSNVAAPYLIDVSKTKTEDYPSTPPAVDSSAPLKVHSKRADKMKHKVTARFEIYKDITQAVLPVSKTWELINTALLTGKQVSQPMKIFVVSQSGKIADVTRQSTCHTEDDSVLKVTSSCSSVYVDGSEMRGSSNATILVKYETFTGTASFLVWMPELSELDIVISDVKLSQIYDWSVPNSQNSRPSKVKRWSKTYEKLPDEPADSKGPAQKYNKNVNFIPSSESVAENEKSNSVCKLKYQQSTIDVYTRFKAVDHDTGRVSYLINRKTWLKITDLVMRGLRIADPHIAILNGRIIVGRSTGRTDVQIVSPLTGRVLGSKEIRVVNDKVSITKLLVNVVSGLQLNIVPDSSGENIYIAETSITRKLSAQYQEGLLDIEVEFSDGTVTSLSDINSVDYAISVDSLSPDVVAFAPMLASRHPRVIAVGEGKGNLLKVSLLLADTCRSEAHLKDFTLVSTSASINVDFYDSSEYGQRSPMFVQNDGGIGNGNSGFFGNNGKEKKRHESEHSSDLQDILNGISSSNDVLKEPAVQARQHQVGKNGYYSSAHRHPSAHLGPMEMGMYIILAAFSFAIIVFVVSCVVYASKYKPQNADFPDDGDSFMPGGYKLLTSQTNGGGKQISQLREPTTTNVHDWVWLGRATLERASGLLVPSISVNDKMRRQKNYKSIRITSNPTYTPQPNPDADLNAESCFRGRGRANESKIDSKTYRKKTYLDLSPDNPNTKLLGSPRQRCFRLPVIPYQQQRRDDEDEEYKPPVPPHQNLDIVSSQAPSTNATHSEEPISDVVYRHKHHHHHHRGHHHSHHHHHTKNKPASDDVSSKNSDTFLISKKGDAKNANADEGKSLQFVNSADNLSKIKHANIVGNPMFSLNKSEEETDDGGLGIEDLNLGMDYKQIMEYFNNLKESTA